MPQSSVINMLKTLQCHALEKLASRAQFLQTGLATLRAKIVGTTEQKNIVINLNESGETLRTKILSDMSLPPTTRFAIIELLRKTIQLIINCDRLKLICGGLILDSSKGLQVQRVTNNSQILVIILSSDPDSQKVFSNYIYI